MLRIERTETDGWKAALRSMRNALNSWDKSDTEFFDDGTFIIRYEDERLMKRLVYAGDSDSKFMRMIHVSADITAPLYWWKQFDTYKVGVTRNSCSTMHTIHKRDLTIDDFSHEWLTGTSQSILTQTIDTINMYRRMYARNGHKDDWWQIIQLLPDSYNQTATIDADYQSLRRMYHQRFGHKLYEWQLFGDWLEKLPCGWLITMEGRSI